MTFSGKLWSFRLTREVPELISADSVELQRNLLVPPSDETRQLCFVQVGPSSRAMEPSKFGVSEAYAFIGGLKSAVESLRDELEGSI